MRRWMVLQRTGHKMSIHVIMTNEREREKRKWTSVRWARDEERGSERGAARSSAQWVL